MSKPIGVLLVDNHPLVRVGIRALLTTKRDVALLGEAAGVPEALYLCRELQPDVLLLACGLVQPSPVEVLVELREHCPALKVVLLSDNCEDLPIPELIAAGVSGCVLKDESVSAFVLAIRSTAIGGAWFSWPVAQKLAHVKVDELVEDGKVRLTPREFELLSLLGKGLSNREIAHLLATYVKAQTKVTGPSGTWWGPTAQDTNDGLGCNDDTNWHDTSQSTIAEGSTLIAHNDHKGKVSGTWYEWMGLEEVNVYPYPPQINRQRPPNLKIVLG